MQLHRELLACLVVAVFATVSAALFAIIDPMGLDQASDDHSAGVVSRVFAADYDGGAQDQPDRPTVLEITDYTLARRAGPDGEVEWPPPRDFYTDVIVTIARERPAAIFLDYMLVSKYQPDERDRFLGVLGQVTAADKWQGDEQCRASPLAKLRCIIAAGGTPVVLGKAFAPDQCGPNAGRFLSADMVDQDGVALLTPLGWTKLPEVYRPVIGGDVYVDAMQAVYGGEDDPTGGRGKALFDACRYAKRLPPLGQSRTGWMGSEAYDLSPAMALFAVQCLKGAPMAPRAKALCHNLLAAKEDETPNLPGLPDQMVVRWGSLPLTRKLDLDRRLYPDDKTAEDCRSETNRPLRRLQVGGVQLASALGDMTAAVRVPCPYSPAFDYGVLEQALIEPGAPDVTSYLRDQVVLVGAAYADSNDIVEDVVHGRQAGVHLHAMAYDNLLRYGADQLRQPPDLTDDPMLSFFGVDWGEILEFACALVVAFMIEVVRRRISRGDLSTRRVYGLSTLVFALCVLLLAGAVGLTQALHWAPVNVVGLFGFIMLDGAVSLWSIEGAIRLARLAVRIAAFAARRAGRLVVAAPRLAVRRLKRLRRPKPPPPAPPDAPAEDPPPASSQPELETAP